MKKYLSLIIIIAFVASCKRDPDATPQPAAPPVPLQDLPSYSYFKKGTYWIYKDSATAILDSVYVPYDTSYTYYQNNNIQAAGNYKYNFCVGHSFYDTYDYEYNISMGNYDISNGEAGVARTRTNGPITGTTYLMSDEYISGNVISHYLSYGETTYQGFNDSIYINGITFHNVVHFHDSGNASETIYASSIGYVHPSTDFYISKNVGIVKKKIVDTHWWSINKTWYLIRYHINQ